MIAGSGKGSAYVFSAVFPKCEDDAERGNRHAHGNIAAVERSVGYYIRTLGIAKRGNVFEKFRLVNKICDNVHKVEHGGEAEPDAEASAPEKGRDTEGDRRYLELHKEK